MVVEQEQAAVAVGMELLVVDLEVIWVVLLEVVVDTF